MALTAREWLLLPEKEQQSRIKELSPHECYLLRTELECVCFTDEEKKRFPEEKKESFLHQKNIQKRKKRHLIYNVKKFLRNYQKKQRARNKYH
ncbi:MAG: hypothetical protein Q4P22_07815 [Eubacteriales bacterium]|nr:hypothetical protein [Eubacteriales bacterium]